MSTEPEGQELPKGGAGLNFESKLFQLKPATIVINQPNTQVEGAVAGKLRIAETGDQYDEICATLLVMPKEWRDFHVGEAGQLNRTFDNLMCFSRDMVSPHPDAKVPQALKCAGCAKASWEKWRKDKRKENLPPCDPYYYALFIDTVYKLPLKMYIRSKSKAPFEAGMQELARKFTLMRSQGLDPNIYDISFKLTSQKITTRNLVSYVPKLSNFQAIPDGEKEKFGAIYLEFISRGKALLTGDTEPSSEESIDQEQQNIESQLGPPGGGQEGEVINGDDIPY